MNSDEIKSICRLCLLTDGDMEMIFSRTDLCNRIFECTGIKILDIHTIPSLICEFCKSKLVICFHFIQQCKNANEKFNEIYSKETEAEEVEILTIIEDVEIQTVSQDNENIVISELVEEEEADVESKDQMNNEEVDETAPQDLLEEVNEDNLAITFNEQINIEHRKKIRSSETLKVLDGDKIKYKTKCSICNNYRQNIKQHMLVHSGLKKFKCLICEKEFAQIGNYNHHLNIHKEIKEVLNCSECNKCFSNRNNLKSHIITHSNEKNFSCEICGTSYKYSHSLTAHKKSHTENARPHRCTNCNKAFANQHSLRKHIRTHTGEKPYHCQYATCNKAFSTSGNLHTHLRSHTKQKPFKCEICSMKFGYKNVLKTHMKTHSQI